MQKSLAEFFGTFVLVLGGVGSAVLAGREIGNVGISFAFGIALLAMVYTIGPISGCHINPAVTIGMLLVRKISFKESLRYVAAQLIGAFVASIAIWGLASGAPQGYDLAIGGLGANGYGAHSPGSYSLTACFSVEVLLTAFLVFVVLGSTDVKAPVGFAGLAIGMVLVLIHLVSIPLTNTSVNPARSFGPAIMVGGWALQQLWLFIAAPLVGAMAGAGAYILIAPSQRLVTTRDAETALPSEQVERGPRRVA